MKKLTTIISLLLSTILLYGCEYFKDYTEELLLAMEEVKSEIPQVINADFYLPDVEGIEVSINLKNQSYKEKYVYTSPFTDEFIDLTIYLKKGRTRINDKISVSLLALDSGRNENRIDITTSVPIYQITTESYVDAQISVQSSINGESQIIHTASDARIRGRGNSTQMFPKKPYRINFRQNTSIYGMPASRNYVLLAEYSDKSLMRNVITHKLSSLLSGIEYAIQTRYVELYINSDYQGLYVLTEQVEIHPNKLFIESIPGVYDTGFLLELDQRFYEQNEVSGFDWVNVRGIPYEIKSPDSSHKDFTTAHHDYIYEYLLATEIALENKQGYEDFIDLDNWIDYFIIQEFVKNVDVGWSSVFLYKEPNGKLKFGPLWDFDLALGNADYIDYGPENWYGMRQYKNKFFRLMMDIPDVRAKFRTRMMEVIDLYIPTILEAIPLISDSIRTKAFRNFNKWQILNIYVWPNPIEVRLATSFTSQMYVLRNFVENRAEWLNYALFTDKYNQGNFN